MSGRDAQRALAMIERARAKGRASDVVLSRLGTPGGYNPDTGRVEPGSDPATYAASGVKDGYKQADIDGTLVQQGDQRIYIPAQGFTRPESGETLTVDGAQCNVVGVSVIAPGATDILYIAQVRGL